jgi:hypothetical protein
VANPTSEDRPPHTETKFQKNEIKTVYRVRVAIVDNQGKPIEEGRIWSSLGGEVKKVGGGWEIDIPAANRPRNGKLTLFASKESAFLQGKKDIFLGEDPNPAVLIQLSKDTSSIIRGVVIDELNNTIVGARVSIAGNQKTSATTDANGNFILPAYASAGEQVLLRVEKDGYKSASQLHPAGEEPATIVLERNKL